LCLAAALIWRAKARWTGGLIAAAVVVQVALGSSMVLLGIPLSIAVAHNGGAALLLLSVVNAHKRIWQYRREYAGDELAGLLRAN
jgi:cytochrome c oxidase assembly protein subunit 15